jgi:Flp pilus assembly protein TadD
VRTGMKPFDTAASFCLAIGLLMLGGCGDFPWKTDAFAINGPISYPSLMRIGDAAHAGGDLATALTIYRRASALDNGAVAPLVGAGDVLVEMGHFNEAILSFNAALGRSGRDPAALRGLARAYMISGQPALAGQPLAIAYEDSPNDPKLLELIGVADDFVDRHEEAQARYRQGLELSPGDPALSLDLALSLALSGNCPVAIAILRPIATAPNSTLRERQTLALIYGLQGDQKAAAQMARLDLDPESVQHNLAYYESLRKLSPEALHRAIESLGAQQATSEQPS